MFLLTLYASTRAFVVVPYDWVDGVVVARLLL